ncbi:unnamed protein product [Paramecium octaurelia]|uniref:Uncharacterized protein n=1 Tax=Paramecium octaurelia TaxID=43137 RepID=A0A8S1YJW4_PAROT|nr:unnamed protein product [Paramecium octaurelia]
MGSRGYLKKKNISGIIQSATNHYVKILQGSVAKECMLLKKNQVKIQLAKNIQDKFITLVMNPIFDRKLFLNINRIDGKLPSNPSKSFFSQRIRLYEVFFKNQTQRLNFYSISYLKLWQFKIFKNKLKSKPLF